MQVSKTFSRLANNEFRVFAENLNQWLQLSTQTLNYLKRQERVEPSADSISENDYWSELAVTFSDSWKIANKELKAAKQELNALSSPDHTPLGLIGSSLDSVFIEEAEERYNNALANFVLEDEKLHKNPEISKQLNMALSQHFKKSANQEKLKELKHTLETQQTLLKEFMSHIRTLTDLPKVPVISEAYDVELPKNLDLEHSDHTMLIKSVTDDLSKVVEKLKQHDGLKILQEQQIQRYKPVKSLSYVRNLLSQMSGIKTS